MKRLSFSSVVLVTIMALISACTPAPAPTPTVDAAAVTQAARKTADAQLTADALANPTATNTPQPTLTHSPQPSPTITLTETPAGTATITKKPTVTPSFTATQRPTHTPVTPVDGYAAKFLYANTFPGLRTEFVPNETFSLGIGFENTGTQPWLPGSALVLVNFKGEITCDKMLVLDHTVNPGEKADFSIWGFAPSCSDGMCGSTSFIRPKVWLSRAGWRSFLMCLTRAGGGGCRPAQNASPVRLHDLSTLS